MAFKGIDYKWKDRKRHLGMPLSFTRYALSEDRLFLETGFFNIKDEEVVLYRIRDISMKRTLGQRIFGVGTITVVSSDKSCPKVELKNVKKPAKAKPGFVVYYTNYSMIAETSLRPPRPVAVYIR